MMLATMIRAEKTTPNEDDYKVLLIGVTLCVLGLFADFFGSRYYHMFLVERPFVSATLKVEQLTHYDKPTIMYHPRATMSVDGTWIAIIRDKDNNPLSYRRGLGSYHNDDAEPKRWTWEVFFGTHLNERVPRVPKDPFKVCVRYLAVTRGTKVYDESPEYCSTLFNPGS